MWARRNISVLLSGTPRPLCYSPAATGQGLQVKIATYNINGINGRLPRLLEWLAEAQPDVVCLQELKSASFPAVALREAGYFAVWSAERAFSCSAEHSRRVFARPRSTPPLALARVRATTRRCGSIWTDR
jgi:hypothetical protein